MLEREDLVDSKPIDLVKMLWQDFTFNLSFWASLSLAADAKGDSDIELKVTNAATNKPINLFFNTGTIGVI